MPYFTISAQLAGQHDLLMKHAALLVPPCCTPLCHHVVQHFDECTWELASRTSELSSGGHAALT